MRSDDFKPEDNYFWVMTMKGVIRNGPDYQSSWPLTERVNYLVDLYSSRLTMCCLTVGLSLVLWITFQA